MKILVVCQYYYPEPFRVTDICESLVQKGHEVTVLTGLPNYPEGVVLEPYKKGQKRQETLNGVEIIRTHEIGRGKGSARLFMNYLSFALSGTVKALKLKDSYDVVLVNQLSPVFMGIPALFYKKKHHKKILFYCLDLWPASLSAGGIKESSIIYKIFKKISLWIYQSADELLITSKSFEQYFDEELQLTNVPKSYLPQYAEDLFEEVKSTKENTEHFNFVFAGNIGDMQSVETIIKAANELKAVEHIKIHVVGDGSKLASCKELALNYQLNNVIFHGRKPVEAMREYYEMADAMLITLRKDKFLSYTLPGKVQSYMAAGKPIIGAIDGETSRVIKDAECGLVCDAEDYLTLANYILEFSKLKSYDRYASQSKQYYQSQFSKESFMNLLENKLIDLKENSHV